jgi:hypothetical protein
MSMGCDIRDISTQRSAFGGRGARARVRPVAVVLMASLLLGVSAEQVNAQDSISEVLTFLVTNRSIPTGDFARDEQAASATRDTIAGFLVMEFATLPVTASSGGFTYRMDPGLGTVTRSSDSFGPFYTERTLTAGRGHSSFGVSYRTVTFDNIDGRDLRNGSLVSTATSLRTDAQPFDVETIAIRIRTSIVTVLGNVGVTDRLDVSAAVPFIRLTLAGERVDNYRGQQLTQAIVSASGSGVGDVIVRAKYNMFRAGASGLAAGVEGRLPTGDEANLMGTGEGTVKPRLIGSVEAGRVGLHGDIGYVFGGVSGALDYAGGVTVVAVPRLTLIGEVVGTRLSSFGRLTETTEPHPRLVGVDTIRLTGVLQATNRALAVGGIKWNVAGSWILSGHVVRALTTAGLNARWIPTVTFDYSFGR